MKPKLALIVMLMLLLPLMSACGVIATPTTQPAAAPTSTKAAAGAPTEYDGGLRLQRHPVETK